VQHTLFFSVDDRVVVGAVEFDLDKPAQPVQAVGQHAQHMGRATQRVTVLQAMQRRGRGVDGQVLADPRSNLHLPRVRLGGKQALVKVLGVALQRHHVEGSDAGGELEQVVGAGIGQAGEAGHHRSAVHQCQRFLGPQYQRRPAQFAVYICCQTALALEQHFTLA